MKRALLSVEGLDVWSSAEESPLLRDVGMSVGEGEIVGVVGESGSGKTMLALALMGMLPSGFTLTSGAVRLDGDQLVATPTGIRRSADELVMIFQNPAEALNPMMQIGRQVARAIAINQGLGRRAARLKAISMLSDVGIPGAAEVATAYPHELSGGMNQRVMIAMALACKPKVLIADEPTTALDVTVQAQIFGLIGELAGETGCGVIFITHDLGAVAELSDRVVVLYGGQVMEKGETLATLTAPAHPYTQYLLESARGIPVAGEAQMGGLDEAQLGVVDVRETGCRYRHRCPLAFEACSSVPPLFVVDRDWDHAASCFLRAPNQASNATP